MAEDKACLTRMRPQAVKGKVFPWGGRVLIKKGEYRLPSATLKLF